VSRRETGVRLAILLVEPEPNPSGRPCAECGERFARLTRIRSAAWEGEVCDVCLAQARSWGAEVTILAG
jgi:hypothetical protein